jgi:hypothetical protein
MTFTDIVLLVRKIGIGVAIALIPFLIFFIGLRLIHHIF